MRVDDYDYELPPELIAQTPPASRDASRMLVLDRATGRCELRGFREFASFLRPGDCLVLNDTRVFPARLLARRATAGAGRVELLLLEPLAQAGAAAHAPAFHVSFGRLWKAMARPGRRLKAGEVLALEGAPDETVTIAGRLDDGTFAVRFQAADVAGLLERTGRVPLPPYIEREADAADRERYQTVYADRPGAVAAPTAGLHFTPEILAGIQEAGVAVARVTLHVGPGTFQPVKADRVEEHVMHAERYELRPEAAAAVNAARAGGGRVVAIGTTSVRVLESCVVPGTHTVAPGTGETRLFLYPPKRPQVTDVLLTNFHLPRSTLLMLVSTFSSLEQVQAAYALAVRERFRFFSYGDCMLLI